MISKNIPYPFSPDHLYSGLGRDIGKLWVAPGPCVLQSLCISGDGYHAATSKSPEPSDLPWLRVSTVRR